MRFIVAALLLAGALALEAMPGVSGGVRATAGRASRGEPWVVRLAPAESVRILALGHDEFAADWYWMGALQYYGSEANRSVYYKDLHEYLDRVVALDPGYHLPYRFGAAAIPYHKGNWVWLNLEESNRIIRKGTERFPRDWSLWLQLGFNLGLADSRYKEAAEAYRHAAEIPGSPPWVAPLAGRMIAESGDLDIASDYCDRMMNTVSDPRMKALLEKRKKEIETERVRRRLSSALRGCSTEVRSIHDMVLAGCWPPDVDPAWADRFHISDDGRVLARDLVRGVLDVVHR